MTDDSDTVTRPSGVGAATLSNLRASISRMILGYGTLIAATVGSVLYYISYVVENTYLGDFGLSPALFGNGRPDVVAVVIPVIIFGSFALTGLYQGLTDDKDPPQWLQRIIERSLSGDPKKAVYRVSFWSALVIFLVSFASVHVLAKQHGQMKAYLIPYKFNNLACADGCVAYHFKSSNKTKQAFGKIDLLGIPVQTGNGLIAVYNGTGVAIVKADDIGMMAPAKMINAKKQNRSWPFDLILASGLY